MSNKSKLIFGIMIVITVVAIVMAVKSNNKVKALQSATGGNAAANAVEIEKIVAEVGKHLVLPESEVPTMAMVSDLSKLKDQPFFERAELGDIVLIYASTRRAVLWRPSAQKIIEISAINLPAPVVSTSPAATTAQPAKR
jgi:hypothetical protein